MCYSFKTSIISYSLGMLSAFFALATKQYILGTLILFYCQMQLSEAMIWKGIDERNISLNKTGTKYGRYLLPSHIFAVGLGYLIAMKLVQKQVIKPVHFLPMLIGVIFYLVIIFGPYQSEKYSSLTYPADQSCMDRSCQNNGNRLRWPYPHSWYLYAFLLCIMFAIIFIKPLGSKIFIGSMFVVSLIVSWLIYPRSVGSVWCFGAAVLAPVMVLGNYLIIRKKSDTEILT